MESYNDDDDEDFIHIPYVSGGTSFEQNSVYGGPSNDKPSKRVRPNGNAPSNVEVS